jgi:hypothetical protein
MWCRPVGEQHWTDVIFTTVMLLLVGRLSVATVQKIAASALRLEFYIIAHQPFLPRTQ